MAKRYPLNDPAAQHEQKLALWLEGLDLSTISTIPSLSRVEAEYIAERLVQDMWVFPPGAPGSRLWNAGQD